MWILLLQLCFDFHLSGITFSIPSHSVCVCPYSWSESLVDSIYGLPRWLNGKESPACRRPGFDLWVRKIPWRREWLPTPVFLPGEFHGQRSLAGYSPWGCKESDMTERLHFTSLPTIEKYTVKVVVPTCSWRREWHFKYAENIIYRYKIHCVSN